MPKRRSATYSEDAIRSIALRFASEVAGLVRGGIANEVSSQVSKILEGISRGGQLSVMRGESVDRRIGKPPVPVTCPAPGCKNTGIRAKRNFCADHAASLSEAEKNRFREAQQADKTVTPAAAHSARRAKAAKAKKKPNRKKAKKE
ncbi:MAG TPA: hypothetical protein VH877_27305 [Polyangia bacterium]|jgi:hypothetical protein|nr:hypothetical protein [Polyangia bacterium]